MPILLNFDCIFAAAIVPITQLNFKIMDQVFILYSVDSNDETSIIRVFSSYKSAHFFKDELEVSFDLRKSFNLCDHDRLFIVIYEVWK